MKVHKPDRCPIRTGDTDMTLTVGIRPNFFQRHPVTSLLAMLVMLFVGAMATFSYVNMRYESCCQGFNPMKRQQCTEPDMFCAYGSQR